MKRKPRKRRTNMVMTNAQVRAMQLMRVRGSQGVSNVTVDGSVAASVVAALQRRGFVRTVAGRPGARYLQTVHLTPTGRRAANRQGKGFGERSVGARTVEAP